MLKTQLITIATAFLLTSISVGQEFLFEGTPYLSFDDSPFAKLNLTFLEDFEDGLFNAPGSYCN